MYYLSSICFLCLSELNSSKNVVHTYGEHASMNKRFKSVFPELVLLEPDIPASLCSTCYTKLNDFHEFKIKCIEKFLTWREYVSTLQGNGDSAKNKLCELQIEVNKEHLTQEENELKLIKLVNKTSGNIKPEPDYTPILETDLKLTKLVEEIEISEESVNMNKTYTELRDSPQRDIYNEGENSMNYMIVTNDIEASDTQIIDNMQEENSELSFTKNTQRNQMSRNKSKTENNSKKMLHTCCLESHLLIHFDKKHFNCFLCKKTFLNESGFKKHIEISRKIFMKNGAKKKRCMDA